MPRLKEQYRNQVVPAMMEEFGYDNPMRVPRLEKIVVNIGLGEAMQNARALDAATEDLRTITGQQPAITRARKSIAGFKLREGRQIGAKVTMRGNRMWDFMDRLCNVALPRQRDFQGISEKGFDKQGNLSIGLRNELIFPEIDIDKIGKPKGLSISFGVSGRPEHTKELLEMFGLPFRKKRWPVTPWC